MSYKKPIKEDCAVVIKMPDFDVAVVGAGPAGCVAANELAKNDLQVVLLEEHDVVGSPICCGEGISCHVLEEFELPSTGADYFKSHVNLMTVKFPNGTEGYLTIDGMTVDRSKFDQYLAKRAVNSGADLRLGHRVTDIKIRRENGELSCALSDGETIKLTAEMIVAADGPMSRLASQVGLPAPKPYVQGFQYRLNGMPPSESLIFHFDNEKFSRGYAWVSPRGKNTANAGLATTAQNPTAMLDEFIQRENFELDIEEANGGIIPMTGPVAKTFADRFITVGDAAGMTNSILYGGIRIAMNAARIAAKYVVKAAKACDFSENTLAGYQEEWLGYPFVSPDLPLAHEFLYNWPNERLEKMGTILNGKTLDKLGFVRSLSTTLKVLSDSKFRKSRNELKRLIACLKISRDWGF